MEPVDFGDFPYEATEAQHAARQFYPPVIDSVPVEERQKEGYFFSDEVTSANAENVRFLRCRDVRLDYDVHAEEDVASDVHWTHPGVPLPNLEVIVGNVDLGVDSATDGLDRLERIVGSLDIRNAEVTLPALSRVGDRVYVGRQSSLNCPNLIEVECGGISAHGSVSCERLRSVGHLELYHGRFSFPRLEKCEMLDLSDVRSADLSLLRRAGTMRVYGGGDYSFSSLEKVDSYLVARGVHSVDAQRLSTVGGLTVESSSDGVFNFPSLFEVGGAYRNRADELVYHGDCEVISGHLETPKLQAVYGSLEYCHDGSAVFSSLNKVKGDLFVNCGHWISTGPGSKEEDGLHFERRKIDDPSGFQRRFSLPSLASVGGRMEVHDNTFLSCPVLERVGKTLDLGRVVNLDVKGKIEARRFSSRTPGQKRHVNIPDKGLSV